MKKIEALSEFGPVTEIARICDITHAAVSQWGENVPALREYQLLDYRRWKHDENHVCSTHGADKSQCSVQCFKAYQAVARKF